MKLTKLQRHTAYIIMLKEAKNWYDHGFCHMIFYVFDLSNKDKSSLFDAVVGDYFKELWEKKPPGRWPSWNKEGWVQRKKWLRECIKETS